MSEIAYSANDPGIAYNTLEILNEEFVKQYHELRYEGYPHFYYKTELELSLAETGKKLTAFVYIMHEERKLGIPTSTYIRTCVDGYRQFGFDLKHLRKAVDISEREVYHHENG